MGKPRVLETKDAGHTTAATAQTRKEEQGKTEKKRRKIHPIRRIARFLLGSEEKQQRKENNARQRRQRQRQRLGDHLDEGKTCHGPSRWHNLLPFLEPLFAIDPKLSFIEDRILGRCSAVQHHHQQQQPQDSTTTTPTTHPKSLVELQQYVQEADAPCTCDECAPKLYKISTAASHGVIHDHLTTRHAARNKNQRKPCSFTYKTSATAAATTSPSPHLTLRFYGTYESMTLVRHHIAWLDATYLHPSARPTPSVLHLRSLLSAWYPHLSAPDLRSSLSPAQLNTLFKHLNRVFYADCVPPHKAMLSAGFTYLAENQTNCFGKSFFNPLVGTQILLHPVLFRGGRMLDTESQTRQARMHSRLGTLLHEMAHAFLKAYVCRACPMYDVCVGALGHGRAWQVLAAKIEQVAKVVVGGSVDLGRWQSLLRDCGGSGRLPSVHDLEVFGLAGQGSGCCGGGGEKTS
jgi:hypothetical protein